MKGWLPDGSEITLDKDQEHAVRAILDWEHDGPDTLFIAWPRGGDRTAVLATVARLVTRRNERNYVQRAGQDDVPAWRNPGQAQDAAPVTRAEMNRELALLETEIGRLHNEAQAKAQQLMNAHRAGLPHSPDSWSGLAGRVAALEERLDKIAGAWKDSP